MTPTNSLAEVLISKNLITATQWQEAVAVEEKSGRSAFEILLDKGWLQETQLSQSLSELSGLAFVDLDKYASDEHLVRVFPRESAEKYCMLPIFESASSVTVAMANPLDEEALTEAQRLFTSRVRPVVATPTQLKDRIQMEYQKNSVPDFIAPAPPDVNAEESPLVETEKVASLAPVIGLVDQLITKAVEMGASDIHIEPQAQRIACRYRVDGILQSMSPLPKEYDMAIISRIKIMANMDIAEKRLPQDGRLQTKAAGKAIDLRISSFPTLYGENLVLRILDRSRAMIKLEQLGMPPVFLDLFKGLIHLPHGMLLVTGPTGSGKTTTLYAGLNQINSLEKNIMTLEDPVEYEIERVRQSQVNVKAGLTFASGLRSIVRQDPDIIMIGEIRDFQTAEIAIHAALTGHLVLSTLHTNNAVSAAARLIDIGVEPFLISSALLGVLAQRLIRVLCPHCKQPYKPDPDLLEKLELPLDTQFYQEKGCVKCRNSGFSGRLGIFELFVLNDEIKGMINRKLPAHEIAAAAVKGGMRTLRDDGIAKLVEGTTSLSEVLRVTQDR